MRTLTTALDLLGLALVAIGLVLFDPAAAVVGAGAATLFVSWRLTR